MDCAAFELLLADAVENALPEATAATFAAHAESCARCRGLLAQGRQGREWLLLLKNEPLEPPAGLVETILARTSGTQMTATLEPAALPAIAANPVGNIQGPRLWKRPALVTLRRAVFDPRLALTAAMAFFSISLTLNLLGVRLTDMKAADLAPQNLRRTMTRQYVEANSRVVRYYENLRFVYEVESRVQELRRATQTSEPAGQPQKQNHDKSSSGSSSDDTESHRAPLARTPGKHPYVHAVQVPLSPLVDAALRLPEGKPPAGLYPALSYDASEKRFYQRYPRLTGSASFISCDSHRFALERSAV
jgi:hypothetical protein